MKYDVPIGMEVTLKIGCPNACDYCPQGVLAKAYHGEREFTLDSFRYCLERGEVPVTRNLTFMGFGEPFLCRDAARIIRWAMAERGHGGSWSTTLRGITHADIDALADLRPTDTVIHVPDDRGQMKLEPDDNWCELFKHAIDAWRHHPDFVISVFGIAHPKVRPIWEASGIPVVNFGLHDRAGLVDCEGCRHHKRHEGRLFDCGKRFCGHLLPNGDICRCCSDYGLANVWGNLKETTYAELYRGEKFRAFMASLADPNSDVACRNCNDGYHQVNVEDRHKTFENPC
jgi:hypothetical protein